MKTYTFYYYDNLSDFMCDKKKEFVYSSSRFPVAFDAFLDFIVRSNFCYFMFANFYSVAGRHKASQLRHLPYDCFLSLDKFRIMSND